MYNKSWLNDGFIKILRVSIYFSMRIYGERVAEQFSALCDFWNRIAPRPKKPQDFYLSIEEKPSKDIKMLPEGRNN